MNKQEAADFLGVSVRALEHLAGNYTHLGSIPVWHRMEQIMGNTLRRRADIFEHCTDLSAYAVLLEKKKRTEFYIDSHSQ
jgi:hypothetical protein